jgi:hypothetical protein
MGVLCSDLVQRGNRGGLHTTFFDKEGQLIETMNSKRSASSRTPKPTSSPRKAVAQTSLSQDVSGSAKAAQPTDVSEDSSSAQAAESNEPSKVRRIQGYEADWQRWDQLAQLQGDKKQSQATLLRSLMQMAESQISGAGQGFKLGALPSKNEDVLSKENALTELMNHIPQLLAVMTSLTVQFQQNQQQQQELNLRLSQVLQALAGNGSESFGVSRPSGRKANGTVAPKGSFAVLDSKELKKSHAKGSAEEKLKRTFDAIVVHNEAPERTHAEKWAINQNALAELTGCNRPAIKQFLKEYAADIELHHQNHELLPRHNYAHGKLGVKITDIIAW